MTHTDPIHRHIILPLSGGQLPSLAIRKSFLPIAQAPDWPRFGPLAFDGQDGTLLFGDDEIHLPAIRVAEEPEVHIPPPRILFEVDPLQQVTGNQILEPRSVVGDE